MPTRVIGKAKLYKLNKDNIIIRKLIDIDDTLILNDLKMRAEKQNIKVTA